MYNDNFGDNNLRRNTHKSLLFLIVDFYSQAEPGERIEIKKVQKKARFGDDYIYATVVIYDNSDQIINEYHLWLRDVSPKPEPILSRINLDEATKQYFDMLSQGKIDKSYLKKTLGISEERFSYLKFQYGLDRDNLLFIQQRRPIRNVFSRRKRRRKTGKRKWKSLTDRERIKMLPY